MMGEFRKLSETMWASPQIDAADVARASEEGFALIVNNRPDGEDLSQPQGDVIAEAARAAGIDYLAIPIDHSGMSDEKIAAMADALAQTDGRKVLAYCRSGTRSTFLWSLAKASQGAEPEGLIESAASAGYDVSMMRGTLKMLADKAGT